MKKNTTNTIIIRNYILKMKKKFYKIKKGKLNCFKF